MGLNTVTYALSKKYTNDSISGVSGVLAGKNCTIDSIVKVDGVNTVTFKWEDASVTPAVTRTTQMIVNDGIGIKPWVTGDTFAVNEVCIYNGSLYQCTTAHTAGATFDVTKWQALGSADSNYGITSNYSTLPSTLTVADLKMYYCISDYTNGGVTYLSGYYLWNGSAWVRTQPKVLDRFTEVNITDLSGAVIGHNLYFDGKKVITDADLQYVVVDSYSDIDVTKTVNLMYFVKNITVNALTGDIEHYSGHYFYDGATKAITFINERETTDIDFATDYTSPVEG